MTHISKILLLIVLPFLPEIHLQAQTIRVESKDGTFRSDTVAKQVLDYPCIGCIMTMSVSFSPMQPL